jgi:uncharacterized protein
MTAKALLLVAALVTGIASTLGARAQTAGDLYQSVAIVTGEGEAERSRGFGRCLEDVLVKVSGDPGLATDAGAAALEGHAADFVAGFRYEDRMKTVPQTHEQGTRDRPFDLFVTFDEAKIDTALRALGRAPWKPPRPRLAVILGIADATARYVLAADGERGEGQRQSLAAASAKRGLPLVIPSLRQLTAQGIAYDGLMPGENARIEGVEKEAGGDAALVGRLVWVEAMPGWTAEWHLSGQGRDARWQRSDTSFDDAFRHAIDGAAQILSNHGAPLSDFTAPERSAPSGR